MSNLPYRMNAYLPGETIKPQKYLGKSPALIEDVENYYRAISEGNLLEIINSDKCILIVTKLKKILNKYIPDQFEVQKVTVFRGFRHSIEEEWNDYYKIFARQKISRTEFEKIDTSGLRIWQLNSNLYVSEKLKEMIEVEMPTLSFTQSIIGPE